jgi:hypothetical protein
MVKRLALVCLMFVIVAIFEHPVAGRAQDKPTISITIVPPAGGGGETPMYPISGSVKGVDFAKYKVVVYACADNAVWYVQPTTERPLTNIDASGDWVTITHPGRLYAALLVGASFVPPAMSLPQNDVISSVTVPGKETK